MNKKQQKLFEKEIDKKSQKKKVLITGKDNNSEKIKTDSGENEILIDKKLELYLKKYIHSFDKVHNQIELKGKLIDLIRKI